MSKPEVIFEASELESIVSMIQHRDKIIIATDRRILEYENESFRETKLVHSISDFPPEQS